jgi:hypothetical protein
MTEVPEAFNSLTYIFGKLAIAYCDKLRTIVGFDAVTRVEGPLIISDNEKHNEGLTKIGPAFGELTVIAGEELSLSGNWWLTEVDAFQKLRMVAGYFYLRQNHRLVDLPGFSKLEYVHLNLDINNNGKKDGGIASFGGFPELLVIQGSIKLHGARFW